MVDREFVFTFFSVRASQTTSSPAPRSLSSTTLRVRSGPATASPRMLAPTTSILTMATTSLRAPSPVPPAESLRPANQISVFREIIVIESQSPVLRVESGEGKQGRNDVHAFPFLVLMMRSSFEDIVNTTSKSSLKGTRDWVPG